MSSNTLITPPGEYQAARIAHDVELARLRSLEAAANPFTFAHLDEIGVQPGWSCVDVGAGTGAVAHELRRRVGPSGRVVAADIDTRFLTSDSGVEVRSTDIRSQAPGVDEFDLACARGLLENVPDPLEALANIVRSVKPGGTVLIEVADTEPFGVSLDGGRTLVADVSQQILGGIAAMGRLDAYLGRHALRLAHEVGLRDIRSWVGTIAVRGGDPIATFWADTFEATREISVGLGLATSREVAALVGELRDPTFRCLGPVGVGVAGRR